MSNRFYGEANDETKLVTKLYGGSSNGAVRINKLYGPVNQTLLTFTNPTNVSVSKKIFLDKTTDAGMTDFNGRIEMLRPSSFPTLISTLTIRPDTGSIISLKESSPITSAKAVALLSEWGIYTTTSYLDSLSQTNVYYTLSSFTSTTGFGTKLIHQGFERLGRGYGYIEYYTNTAHTTSDIVVISTQGELDSLSFTSTTATPVSIGGASVGPSNVKNVVLNGKVTSIPINFFAYCSLLESADFSKTNITSFPKSVLSYSGVTGLSLPPNLETIGNSALSSLYNFSQTIHLPQTLTAIGSSFLSNMYNSFTLDVGALNASIADSSNMTLRAFNNNQAAYTQGIRIAGSERSSWLSRFPNSSSYHRNLVDAGY